MSNVGAWDKWYAKFDMDSDPTSFRYGDTCTYLMAAAFLSDCVWVEDWGCGAGGFSRFRQDGYLGVDGSDTPFADVAADLATYRSMADGILLRHVLEHNRKWQDVLDNAIISAQKKLCVVFFTPFSEKTKEIADNTPHGIPVPDISFSRKDIENRISKFRYRWIGPFPSETGYGEETVLLCWK